MIKKEVLVLLTDRWADWEASFAIAEINSSDAYVVKTIAVDKVSKASIGGLRAEIDYTLDAYQNFDKLAMLILPGGYAWQESRHDRIAAFVRQVAGHGIPVAAICGATIFLGKHGFLDHITHTGDDLELFEREQGYHGRACYTATQIVADNGFITANETAGLEFARAIFTLLRIDTDEEIAGWYDKFKHGMVR